MFDEITEVLVPPSTPIGCGTAEQWATAERQLGLRFPSDYKEFVSLYGFGSIEGQFYVLSPFAGPRSFEREIAEARKAHEVLVQYEPLHPPGLIPWGRSDEGGECFWETDRLDSEYWTVYTEYDELSLTYRYEENMTTFLLKVLTGSHLSPLFKSQVRPFQLPAYYYPWSEKLEVHVRFGPSSRSHAEWVRLAEDTIHTREMVSLGDGRTECMVAPDGWHMSFISVPRAASVHRGAGRYQHELLVYLPGIDIEKAKAMVARLAVRQSEPIEAAWQGGTAGAAEIWTELVSLANPEPPTSSS